MTIGHDVGHTTTLVSRAPNEAGCPITPLAITNVGTEAAYSAVGCDVLPSEIVITLRSPNRHRIHAKELFTGFTCGEGKMVADMSGLWKMTIGGAYRPDEVRYPRFSGRRAVLRLNSRPYRAERVRVMRSAASEPTLQAYCGRGRPLYNAFAGHSGSRVGFAPPKHLGFTQK